MSKIFCPIGYDAYFPVDKIIMFWASEGDLDNFALYIEVGKKLPYCYIYSSKSALDLEIALLKALIGGKE